MSTTYRVPGAILNECEHSVPLDSAHPGGPRDHCVYPRGRRAGRAEIPGRTPQEQACSPIADLVDVLDPPHVEDGTAIRRVMIEGRVVVEDGRVLTADMGRVRALAEAAVERMRAATGSARLTAELLEPSLIGACQALAARPYSVERALAGSRPRA